MLSFALSEEFISQYKDKEVDWGYKDAGNNSLGEITFLRTYSRLKDDGTKERWWEVCERVINGMFSIQKDHCRQNRLPWNDRKAHATAQDAFDRLFNFKWTPPGRGLFIMGTPVVNEQRVSTPLQNCSHISSGDMTKYDPSYPFTFLMEASMYGVGVGFDTKGAQKNFEIYQPKREGVYVVPDTREGWVESVKILLEAYLMPHKTLPVFDYSHIRAVGLPLKTFGGVAPGPDPLQKLHKKLIELFDIEVGNTLGTRMIADIGNLIGVCVVSGNIRRSAEILLGNIDDEEFLSLKDYSKATGKARAEWSWASNNSVTVNVGDDLSKIIPGIAKNGEPGVFWLDTARNYGRLIDPPDHKDHRVTGINPCAEIMLESGEFCTLSESYLNRHDSLEDYKKTLKVAYLYGKTVTLLPTHWPRSNAIMQRNRRIGMSMSGIANFADNHGLPKLCKWMDEGYKYLKELDHKYSEWLCVRDSIRVATVKPSGTTSILAGESPGVHWSPGGKFFLRSVRFGKDDPMVKQFHIAGYRIEPAESDPENTVVVYFPIKSSALRSERDVTLFEKAALAATAQRYWSDNSVSVTLSFDPEKEGQYVSSVLGMYEGQLKTVSFLPMLDQGAYAQMPYSNLTEEEYCDLRYTLWPIDLASIYDGGQGEEAVGEVGCTTDVCIVKEDAAVAQLVKS